MSEYERLKKQKDEIMQKDLSNQQQLIDQQAKEIERLQEREFNHYPITIYELEMKIFKLQDDLEAAHDALEMLPPKEMEISEKTKLQIDNTVSKLLAEHSEKKLELAVKALEEIHGIRETFPLGAYKHHLAKGFDRAEILAGYALEEIKRLGEGVNK